MPLVTLIGEKLAKVGNEFIYIKANNDCRNCKLKTVCFNLKPGRRYQITKIREKRHSCSVHDGVTAVVEVKEMPINAIIDKMISENHIKKFEKIECDNIGCNYYELCNNIALQQDKNYTITRKYDEIIECPIGHNLQKADLTD
jgi:uncharacterized protein (UPF0179 family)